MQYSVRKHIEIYANLASDSILQFIKMALQGLQCFKYICHVSIAFLLL